MRLKTLRKSKGITQDELAEILGVSKATVSRYEQAAIYPSAEVLIRLCRYFSVSADYLLGLSDKIELKLSHLKDDQIVIILSVINEFEKLNELENPAD